MRSSRSSNAAFSLIELTIVLALVSVLLTGSIVAAGTVRTRFQLWLAASQVLQDLAATRTDAISRAVDHRLLFTPGIGSYQRQRLDEGGFTPIGDATPLPAGVIVRSCTAPQGAVQFRPRGNAASFGTIVLESGADSRKVIVNITGHARLG